jgi:flagellar basal-body rod protein FlgB
MSTVDKLFNRHTSGLEKALDLHHRRNTVIASNVSNVDTPGYRATDLDFAGEMQKAFNKPKDSSLNVTNTKHMDISSNTGAHVVEDKSGTVKADGNSVDIDIQMGQMAQNAGRYSTTVTLLRKQMGILKLAIREGAR